jgi:hypothetical protein
VDWIRLVMDALIRKVLAEHIQIAAEVEGVVHVGCLVSPFRLPRFDTLGLTLHRRVGGALGGGRSDLLPPLPNACVFPSTGEGRGGG